MSWIYNNFQEFPGLLDSYNVVFSTPETDVAMSALINLLPMPMQHLQQSLVNDINYRHANGRFPIPAYGITPWTLYPSTPVPISTAFP